MTNYDARTRPAQAPRPDTGVEHILDVYAGRVVTAPDLHAGTGRTPEMLDDLAGDLVAEVVGTVRAARRFQQTTQAGVLSAMGPYPAREAVRKGHRPGGRLFPAGSGL